MSPIGRAVPSLSNRAAWRGLLNTYAPHFVITLGKTIGTVFAHLKIEIKNITFK